MAMLNDKQLSDKMAHEIRLVLIGKHLDDCQCPSNPKQPLIPDEFKRPCWKRRLESAYRAYCDSRPDVTL